MITVDVERRRWDRRAGFPLERWTIRDSRKWICSLAKGRTLEVGVGTGLNLPLYGRDLELSGIDLNPGMLAMARRRATESGRVIDLGEGNAEMLSLPDASFDTVVHPGSLLGGGSWFRHRRDVPGPASGWSVATARPPGTTLDSRTAGPTRDPSWICGRTPRAFVDGSHRASSSPQARHTQLVGLARDAPGSVCLVHSRRDNYAGGGGDIGDKPYGGADAEQVGGDVGDERADRIAGVAPEPVDPDGACPDRHRCRMRRPHRMRRQLRLPLAIRRARLGRTSDQGKCDMSCPAVSAVGTSSQPCHGWLSRVAVAA